MSHIPVQYIVPLSIIIAILITKTGNVYLYWSCITLCSLIIAIRHGEIVWEYGETLVKSLYSYFRSYMRKWNGLYDHWKESNEESTMTEEKEAILRQKVILLGFNYPTQWNRIIKRFVKCLNNEKKI